jgi:hypothetical protein
MTAAVAQTLALQLAVAVMTLGIGVLALRVAPAPGASPRTAAWFMAGVTFTLDGALAVVHSSAAVVAVLMGPQSRFFALFLRFLPAGNDARSLLVLGFALGLAWVLLLGRPAPSARVIVAGSGLFALVGFVAGLAERPIGDRGGGDHIAIISLAAAATALVLLASLYGAMVRERVDWLFWTALALYAVQEAISSNIKGMLAWAGFGGGWAPPVRSIMLTALVTLVMMLACTLRRLSIARAGGDPPGLLERVSG